MAAVEPPPDNSWEGEGWSQYGNARKNNGSDHDFDMGDITAADESLRDHLRSQLRLLTSSPRDRVLMMTLVFIGRMAGRGGRRPRPSQTREHRTTAAVGG